MINKTYEKYGYLHTEMEVETKNLSKVLAELESNEKVFSIDLNHVSNGKVIVRFGSYK